MADDSATGDLIQLRRPLDHAHDHVRGGRTSGGSTPPDVVEIVTYNDFLCPFCRRLRTVLLQLRKAFGDRLAYSYRQFPNERAHPGAEFISRASEAAALQGRFWQMHDALFDREPPLSEDDVRNIARGIGLDMEQFERDLVGDDVARRVEEDLAEARNNGVTGTPTLFIDGQRYDGAWDFYSLLDVLERPVAQRIQRSARSFASLPASGGLVLILAALAALVCANSALAPDYAAFIATPFGIGPPGSIFSMSVGTWFSEGLLAFFFLLVGLEIRRELTAGDLSDSRAATLPIVAGLGGVIAPAAIYLLANRGVTAPGWSVPTATGMPFVLGILAILGGRVPQSLRVFIAAFAIVDDVLSVVTLAIFYPHTFTPIWLLAATLAMVALYVLNRSRVYAIWPYAIVACALWFFLHSGGVHGALTGVLLAALLPTRPTPAAAPLLAQAATALAALEHAEKEARESGEDNDDNPALEWASRNLSAASERLLSPADRVERAVAPWSTYFVLPLFAFSATGVPLGIDFSSPDAARIMFGVIAGLVIGKPLGIVAASFAAEWIGIGRRPEGASMRGFVGAAILCGIGDTIGLLMADQAFPNGEDAALAKIAVLIGSVIAAAIGSAVIAPGASAPARTEDAEKKDAPPNAASQAA